MDIQENTTFLYQLPNVVSQLSDHEVLHVVWCCVVLHKELG